MSPAQIEVWKTGYLDGYNERPQENTERAYVLGWETGKSDLRSVCGHSCCG